MRIIVKAKPRAKMEKVERVETVGQGRLDFEVNLKEKDKLEKRNGDNSDLDSNFAGSNQIPVYKVWVKEPPVDGRANSAIARVLAKHFAIRKTQIRMISGQTSNQKIFEIET